jgi:hypothetical protein
VPGDPHQLQAQGHRCNRRLIDLFILRGIPDNIRSDTEFIATAVQEWIVTVDAKTA